MLFDLTKRKIWFVVSSSKAKLLEPITQSTANDKVEVEILIRTKDEEHNKGLFKQVVDIIGTGVSSHRPTRHPSQAPFEWLIILARWSNRTLSAPSPKTRWLASL